MESHYCRKTSSKLYLENNLSISKIYDLYKEKCEENSKTPVSINVYRRNSALNIITNFIRRKKTNVGHATNISKQKLRTLQIWLCGKKNMNIVKRKKPRSKRAR